MAKIVSPVELEAKMKAFSLEFDDFAQRHFANIPDGVLKTAMAYSFGSGGKRIRPFLVLEVFRSIGRGNLRESSAMYFALDRKSVV